MEQKKDKLAILVCAHKKDPYTRNEGVYKAIQVGKALHPEIDLGYINDNEGDNISAKNPTYCEWTALYWGWKNIKDVEFLGFCHYRRYFDLEITNDNVEILLSNIDIIVPCPRVALKSNYEIFVECVGVENATIFMDTILYLYPNLKDKIIDYLFNSNHYYLCSMFLSKKKLFDELCEFSFSVLSIFENRIKEMPYTRLNRSLAYAGELLLGLYVYCKELRIREIPMKCYNTNSFHVSKFAKIKIDALFRLTHPHRIKEIVPWDSVIVGFKQDNIDLLYL